MALRQNSSGQATDDYGQALREYEAELAHYLEERIRPGLNAGAIRMLARSIARDIAAQEPPEAPDNGNAMTDRDAASEGQAPAPDIVADMRDFQADLGADWILRLSVCGHDRWLTAEKKDGSQHVEAPDPEALVNMVDAVNENVAR